MLSRLKQVKTKLEFKRDIELANALGISSSYFYEIMNGTKNVPKTLGLKLEDKLNINRIWFATGEGDMLLSGTVNEPEGAYIASPRRKGYGFNSQDGENMYWVPRRAYADLINNNLDKITKTNFPMVNDTCYGIEIEEGNMQPEFMPGDFFIGTALAGVAEMVVSRVYFFQTDSGLILGVFQEQVNEMVKIGFTSGEAGSMVLSASTINKIYHKEFIIKR